MWLTLNMDARIDNSRRGMYRRNNSAREEWRS